MAIFDRVEGLAEGGIKQARGIGAAKGRQRYVLRVEEDNLSKYWENTILTYGAITDYQNMDA